MSEAGNGSSIASNRSQVKMRFVGEKCGREPGEGQTRAAIAVVIAGLGASEDARERAYDTASRVFPTCGA